MTSIKIDKPNPVKNFSQKYLFIKNPPIPIIEHNAHGSITLLIYFLISNPEIFRAINRITNKLIISNKIIVINKK